MSDDTPTQRYPDGFPPPGGPSRGASESPDAVPNDAPTERFAAPEASGTPAAAFAPAASVAPADTVPPAATTASPDDNRRSRGLIIGLAIAAGVLLLALIGVLIWLATASGGPAPTPTNSSTPSASPSESPEPSPTPTPSETEEPPPPPPPPPADAIASFTASTEQADCTASGGAAVPLTFSWAATGNRLWFGVGTDDASVEPFAEYPLNYTMNDVSYQCGQPDQQQRYTITVERPDGSHESRTIVIREI